MYKGKGCQTCQNRIEKINVTIYLKMVSYNLHGYHCENKL